MPGTDQVTMIRTFIKHMHHFLNEATPSDNNEVSPSSASKSQKDELKRFDNSTCYCNSASGRVL